MNHEWNVGFVYRVGHGSGAGRRARFYTYARQRGSWEIILMRAWSRQMQRQRFSVLCSYFAAQQCCKIWEQHRNFHHYWYPWHLFLWLFPIVATNVFLGPFSLMREVCPFHLNPHNHCSHSSTMFHWFNGLELNSLWICVIPAVLLVWWFRSFRYWNKWRQEFHMQALVWSQIWRNGQKIIQGQIPKFFCQIYISLILLRFIYCFYATGYQWYICCLMTQVISTPILHA